jgi:hypothetical protein
MRSMSVDRMHVPRAPRGYARTSQCRGTCLRDVVSEKEYAGARRRTDRGLCVLRRLKHNGARTFGAPVRTEIDVRTHDVACDAEEVLEVLPARLVRELQRA